MTNTYNKDKISEYSYNNPESHPSKRSAEVIAGIVKEQMEVDSLLDVGCGVGIWMREWAKRGVSEVEGIDAVWIKDGNLVVPEKWIDTHNLENEFYREKKYDLVTCLEVAEHIDKKYENKLVESLVRHSGRILFSAAIPGQGGVNHVNERFQNYWIKKFRKRGYKTYDIIRPKTWNRNDVQFYYSQNCLLFSKYEEEYKQVGIKNLVHPKLYDKKRQYENLSQRKLLKMIPKYIIQSIKGRLKKVIL